MIIQEYKYDDISYRFSIFFNNRHAYRYMFRIIFFSILVYINPEFLSIVPQKIYNGFNNYGLIALPLFIAMGQVMNKAGLTKKIINFSGIFIWKQRGGLGTINIISSMILEVYLAHLPQIQHR